MDPGWMRNDSYSGSVNEGLSDSHAQVLLFVVLKGNVGANCVNKKKKKYNAKILCF